MFHLDLLLAYASYTGDHPDQVGAFYQSHRHQISHWSPGHLPNLTGSHLPRWEAQGLRRDLGMKGPGLLSAGGDWCTGMRWGKALSRRQRKKMRVETGKCWGKWLCSWNLKNSVNVRKTWHCNIFLICYNNFRLTHIFITTLSNWRPKGFWFLLRKYICENK